MSHPVGRDEFDVSIDGYFAILPEWVIDAEISDRAVRLYAVLRRYANGEMKARPSRAKLAARLRTSLSSIDRALRELQAVGAVTVRHRWANSTYTSFTPDRDEDHHIQAANGYVLHSSPARPRHLKGLVVTGDTPLVVTGEGQGVSPVNGRGVSLVQPGGVSPVTHELKPLEPEKDLSSAMPSKPKPVEARRVDVEALCERLADRIIDNGCKPPTITDGWRRDARLLLDKDGRELDKALRLIDWCQADSFWRSNIQSMTSFRRQYDRLRLKALEQHGVSRGKNGPGRAWQE